MAKKTPGRPKRRPSQPAGRELRASVKPTRGLSGLLNGYSVWVDGEETEHGLGFHVALGKARELNDPLETS